MLKSALKILKQLEDNGFEAYIVGGFARDLYLGKESLDVDICTNATPYDLSIIFKDALIPIEKYGSVTVLYNKIRFEITTFRKEIRYKDNRKPVEIEYIDDFFEDLKRRDFTINALCIDSKGNFIDLMNSRKDIDEGIIKMIGNPDKKLKDDVFRILRAIRFATILNFKLDKKIERAIIRNKRYLGNLSYNRKKEELTRIFSSFNATYGFELIKRLKLGKYLELSNLNKIKIVDDIMGIWAQLDVIDIYPFSRAEKDIIIKINEVMKYPIDSYSLYKYGLYVCSIAAAIKGIDRQELIKLYKALPIEGRKDIKIDATLLCKKLNKKPGAWIKDIYANLEKKIIGGELENNQEKIINYIINNEEIHTLE